MRLGPRKKPWNVWYFHWFPWGIIHGSRWTKPGIFRGLISVCNLVHIPKIMRIEMVSLEDCWALAEICAQMSAILFFECGLKLFIETYFISLSLHVSRCLIQSLSTVVLNWEQVKSEVIIMHFPLNLAKLLNQTHFYLYPHMMEGCAGPGIHPG